MKNRRLRSINVIFDISHTPINEIENIPNLKETVFAELYTAIKFAQVSKKTTSSLFEINNSSFYIDLDKDSWIPSLEQAIHYYEKSEEYEKCLLYKTLINQIYEQKETTPTKEIKSGSRKNIRSSSKYPKGKNKFKAKKVKKSSSRKTTIY